MTHKIVAVGTLIRFVVLPSLSHALMAMPDLLQDVSCKRLIGDKVFDSDALFEALAERGFDV